MADPIVVSYSQLDARRQCPHKGQLSYVERWSKPKDDTTPAGKGTLWHRIMEAHYTALKNGEIPQKAVAAELRRLRLMGTDADVMDLLEWMYVGYVSKWGSDDEWQVLAVEHRIQVPLLNPDGSASGFEMKMIIDLIVKARDTGLVWIIDHKSCDNLPKSKELDLDDQFGLYTWGLRQLGHKPFGSIHNSARRKRNQGDYPEVIKEWERKKAAGTTKAARPKPQELDGRFDRYMMSRTDFELDTIASEALATTRAMYHPDDVAERHTNSDTCRWRCDYTDACLIGRKYGPARERQFLLDVGFTQNFQRH